MRTWSIIARTSAVTAALLALVAVVTAAVALTGVSSELLVAEAWRVVGLATWVAIFAVLAAAPTLLAVWLIALVSKLALVMVGLMAGEAPGAADLVLWDGILSAVLAVGCGASWRLRRASASAYPAAG